MQLAIKDILIKWAKWATPRLGVEYPSISPFYKSAAVSHEYVEHLSEESAEIVEEVILSLRQENELWFNLIMARYIHRVSDRDICTFLNISRATYFNELSSAEAYVQGAIRFHGKQIVFYA